MTYLSRAIEGLRVVTPLCYKEVDKSALDVTRRRLDNELSDIEKFYIDAAKVYNG